MFDVKSTINKMITEEISESLVKNGFSLEGKTAFVKKSGETEQLVYIIFNKTRGH